MFKFNYVDYGNRINLGVGWMALAGSNNTSRKHVVGNNGYYFSVFCSVARFRKLGNDTKACYGSMHGMFIYFHWFSFTKILQWFNRKARRARRRYRPCVPTPQFITFCTEGRIDEPACSGW